MRPAEIKSVLNELQLVPTKGKGQNFLIDDDVARREVEYPRHSNRARPSWRSVPAWAS